RAARHQRAYPPLAGCGRVTGGFMRGRWGAEIFGHAKAQRRKGVAPCGEAALKNGSHEDTKMVRQTQASCTPSSCLRVKLFAASPQTRHLGAFAPLRETILVLFSASPRLRVKSLLCAFLALTSVPALADTLIDNVNGIT